MGATYAIRREFCRRLFRAGGATAELRHAFLDGLSDTAIAAQQSGNAIQSTSANGAAVTFQFFANWQPADVLDLIDEARDRADCADVATALALIGDGPVTSFGHDFSAMGAGGVL